jgi:hypothetical protein
MTARNFASRHANTLRPNDTIHLADGTHTLTDVRVATAGTTIRAGDRSWTMPNQRLVNTERTATAADVGARLEAGRERAVALQTERTVRQEQVAPAAATHTAPKPTVAPMVPLKMHL